MHFLVVGSNTSHIEIWQNNRLTKHRWIAILPLPNYDTRRLFGIWKGACPGDHCNQSELQIIIINEYTILHYIKGLIHYNTSPTSIGEWRDWIGKTAADLKLLDKGKIIVSIFWEVGCTFSPLGVTSVLVWKHRSLFSSIMDLKRDMSWKSRFLRWGVFQVILKPDKTTDWRNTDHCHCFLVSWIIIIINEYTYIT